MRTRYELIVYWSKDDDSFVVEVPELPGCMADGQTYAEAVANALRSVRAEGLDPGRAEPQLAAWARGELTDEQLDEIRRRALHQRELTAEQLLAGVRGA